MKKIFHLLFLLTFLPVVSQELPEVIRDTVTIESGQPVILVVSAFADKDKDASPALARREKAELQKNFPECDVRLIESRCRINFENDARENIFLHNNKTTYELVAYWDGNPSSAVKISPIRTKLTEYISSVTGKKVVSSYLADNKKIFDTIALRKKVNKPNKNSKSFAQFYCINLLYAQRLTGEIWFPDLSKQVYSKVKSAMVYVSRTGEPEVAAFSIKFNEKHLVSHIEYFKRPDNDDAVTFDFEYDANGLIRKMINVGNLKGPNETQIYEYTYDGDIIIESSEDQFSEMYLKNDLIMENRHYEFTDYDKSFLITKSTTVIEDLCKVRYENGLKDQTYCVSGFGNQTPYTFEKILYLDGEPARVSTSKIDREGNKLLISGEARGQFFPKATIALNKYGLVEAVDGGQAKGISYHIRVDYQYFE